MEEHDLGEEGAHGGIALAQHLAGVGIEEQLAIAPAGGQHRRVRIVGVDERRSLPACRGQCQFRQPVGRQGRCPAGDVIGALRPAGELCFIGQKDAGHCQKDDHQAGGDTGHEITPEDHFAKRHDVSSRYH